MEFTLPLPDDLEKHAPSSFSHWRNLCKRYEEFSTTYSGHVDTKFEKTQSLLSFLGGRNSLRIIKNIHYISDSEDAVAGVHLEKLANLCLPKFILLYERYKFFSLKQNKNECVCIFLSKLEHLSDSCDLQGLTYQIHFRDRIVNGVLDEELHSQFAELKDMNLKTVVEICKKNSKCENGKCRLNFSKFLEKIEMRTGNSSEADSASHCMQVDENNDEILDTINGGGSENNVTDDPPDVESCELTSNITPHGEMVEVAKVCASAISAEEDVTVEDKASESDAGMKKIRGKKRSSTTHSDGESESNLMALDVFFSNKSPHTSLKHSDKVADTSATENTDANISVKLKKFISSEPANSEAETTKVDSVKGKKLVGRKKKSKKREGRKRLKKTDRDKKISVTEDGEQTSSSGNFFDIYGQWTSSGNDNQPAGGNVIAENLGTETLSREPGNIKSTSKEYQCKFCSKLYKSKINFKIHMAFWHSDEDECQFCNKSFSKNADLIEHIFTQGDCAKQSKCVAPKRKSYLCDHCQESFKLMPFLKAHVMLMHAEESICTLCYTQFSDQSQLEKHVFQRHGPSVPQKPKARNQQPDKCEYCDQSFKYEANLKIHIVMQHADKINGQCTLCSESFSDTSQLQDHITTKHAYVLWNEEESNKKKFLCDTCGRAFSRKAHLQYHTLSIHVKKKKEKVVSLNFPCEKCGKVFSTAPKLASHEHRAHEKFQCEFCGGLFTRASLYVHKKQVHMGIRIPKYYNHVCSICGKAFSSPSHLKTHSSKHINEKLFQCGDCNMRFKTQRALDRHMTKHSGTAPLRCEDCGKCFVVKSQYLNHIRTHTGETPFPCPHCDKKFRIIESLKEHLAVHDPNRERKFKCSICGTRFLKEKFIKTHMKSVHSDKAFHCEYCGMDFTSNYGLKKHGMRKHGLPGPTTRKTGEPRNINAIELTDTSQQVKKFSQIPQNHVTLMDGPIAENSTRQLEMEFEKKTLHRMTLVDPFRHDEKVNAEHEKFPRLDNIGERPPIYSHSDFWGVGDIVMMERMTGHPEDMLSINSLNHAQEMN